MNWRDNPNLVECFENWQATVRGGALGKRLTEHDERIEEVRHRRKALGLSQDGLAAVCGKSHAFVSQFESGEAGGKPRYLRIIAILDRLEAERAQS